MATVRRRLDQISGLRLAKSTTKTIGHAGRQQYHHRPRHDNSSSRIGDSDTRSRSI